MTLASFGAPAVLTLFWLWHKHPRLCLILIVIASYFLFQSLCWGHGRCLSASVITCCEAESLYSIECLLFIISFLIRKYSHLVNFLVQIEILLKELLQVVAELAAVKSALSLFGCFDLLFWLFDNIHFQLL